MDTEKVVSELNKRFAQPLPPYYKRRVIFWMDEDREYADQLDDFELENAKLIQLTGRHTNLCGQTSLTDATKFQFILNHFSRMSQVVRLQVVGTSCWQLSYLLFPLRVP